MGNVLREQNSGHGRPSYVPAEHRLDETKRQAQTTLQQYRIFLVIFFYLFFAASIVGI